MRLFSYIVEHDLGFAPNPFFGLCSLAACKPKIRRTAMVGDYLVGTGARNWAKTLIYWAKIDEIITYDEYWRDHKYHAKRPVMNGSFMQCYGDNIYHTECGLIEQEDSFHSLEDGSLSQDNFDRDVGSTDRVLLAREFCYLGRNAIAFPEMLYDIVHSTQGHKCNFPDDLREKCVAWLNSIGPRGWFGDPIDWPN